MMNRREFLRSSILGGLLLTLGNSSPWSQVFAEDKGLFEGLKIIDAHAHPDRFVPPGRATAWVDKSSTLKSIRTLGMAASSFAAVGDQVFLSHGRFQETEFRNTMAQLDWWLDGIIKSGQARLVMKASDIPNQSGPTSLLALSCLLKEATHWWGGLVV